MDTRPAPPSPWTAVVRAVLLLTAIISVLITVFAWPAVRSSIHDLPIAVAGPPAAAAQVSAALEQRMPGGFTVTGVTDTASAERLIRDREAYGAIDLTTGTPQVLTASAASATVAQALQSVGAALSQSQAAAPAQGEATPGQTQTEAAPGQAQSPGAAQPQGVAVRDVVALPADDPRGAGLAAGALPLVLGGMLAAVLLTRLIQGRARRITGALAFAVTGGLAMAAILQFWLGSLDGSYLANSGAIALTVAATSLTILGLESLLGTAGFGLGAVLMMLVGNPFSGMASAPEMLPGWSGAFGQLLPPGAGGQLLRSTAFFDGAAITQPIIVLLAWLALGAALTLAGHHRSRRTTPAPAAATEPAAYATA